MKYVIQTSLDNSFFCGTKMCANKQTFNINFETLWSDNLKDAIHYRTIAEANGALSMLHGSLYVEQELNILKVTDNDVILNKLRSNYGHI